MDSAAETASAAPATTAEVNEGSELQLQADTGLASDAVATAMQLQHASESAYLQHVQQPAVYHFNTTQAMQHNASPADTASQAIEAVNMTDGNRITDSATQPAAAGVAVQASVSSTGGELAAGELEASATAAAESSTASIPAVAESSHSHVIAEEGSMRQRRTRIGSRNSSAAVSREPSQQIVGQQQQQTMPMQSAASEASEPVSLAEWTPKSVDNSRSSTPAAPTAAQQQNNSQQQQLQLQQSVAVAGAVQQPAGLAADVMQVVRPVSAVKAPGTSNRSMLGTDSGFLNALARLRPVKTTAEIAAAATSGVPTRASVADQTAGTPEASSEVAVAPQLNIPATVTADAVVTPAGDAVMTPMYYKPASSDLLGLTIQRSTALKPDMLVTNPVVRLHVVSAATGEYVRMLHQTAQLYEQQQQEGVYAAGANNSKQQQRPDTCIRVVDRPLQDKMLESLGRPALTTINNNTACPRPALLDYIPPIQTHPYDMLEAKINNSSPNKLESAATGLVAEWNEELCVDLSIEELKQADALLLLEVLQLPSGFARFQHHVQRFDLAGRSHPIAWAFLRLQGLQVQQQQLAQGKPLQLQLFHYKAAALREVHALSKGFSGQHSVNAAKAAYLSWKMSGFAGPASSSAPSSPRSPLKAVLGGFWPSRDGSTSPSAAAAAAVQQQQQLGSPPLHGRQATEAEKYPGILQVVMTAKPRPSPEQMIVVTDPAADIRPDVPAGYGSGFEHGRVPFGLLHKPRALGAQGGRSFRASNTGAADACGVLVDRQLLYLESRLHRPHTQPCQVPNAVLVDIKGSAGGCSCIAISRDGRWLVAALADAVGRFKVNLYQALTGNLVWTLGTHEGMVYSINWSKDDSAVITTSADYTAKVWHLPVLPSPKDNTQTFAAQDPDSMPGSVGFTPGLSTTGSTALTATAAAVEAAAEAGVVCVVLQHRCFVYAAELHPVRQPWLLAVTGAYDGCLRVWSAEEGTVVFSLQVSAVPINCLCFNQLGSRVFAGDSAGSIHELSVDITPLSSIAATAFRALLETTTGSPSSPLCSSTGNPAVADSGAFSGRSTDYGGSHDRQGEISLIDKQDSPRTPRNKQLELTADEAVSPVAAVLRHGSPAARIAAGHEVLKILRTSIELSGSPIVSVACHPGGHQLLALTKARSTGSKSKGTSDLVVIDMKLLLIARRLGGVKCCSAPLKFGASPAACQKKFWTGAYVLYTPVAVCSFSPYAPIRVLCYSSDEHAVQLNPQNKEAAAAKKQKPQRASESGADASGLRRYVLPDQLTPHHVHAVLADLRESATQRGVYKQPEDPNGQYLVIKAANASHSNAVNKHRRIHGVPKHEQESPGSGSPQHSVQYRQTHSVGRLDPPVNSGVLNDEGHGHGNGKVSGRAVREGDGTRPAGGRNRANRRSRDRESTGGIDPVATAADEANAGSMPGTGKVVLNRRGSAAPWLQQQFAE